MTICQFHMKTSSKNLTVLQQQKTNLWTCIGHEAWQVNKTVEFHYTTIQSGSRLFLNKKHIYFALNKYHIFFPHESTRKLIWQSPFFISTARFSLFPCFLFSLVNVLSRSMRNLSNYLTRKYLWGCSLFLALLTFIYEFMINTH